MGDSKYWLALNQAPGIGPKRFQGLLEHFGSAQAVWNAAREELMQVPGISAGQADALLSFRQRTDVEKEPELVRRCGAKVITLADADYPDRLRQIFDPPPVLYCLGTLAPEDRAAVAIVGTRNATGYGRTVAERLSGELAAKGLTVVSGMARGIDTAAHTGALRAGGRTIAVLGCGLDIVYPRENRQLMDNIAASGAVLSVYPFGTQPEAGNFPARNRIISGLALGTVVIEAQEKSGALITADFALEQGREVFAVPGNITSPASAGTNRLIAQGAKLVDSAAAILEEFPEFAPPGAPAREVPAQAVPADLPEEEKAVLAQMRSEAVHIDALAAACGMTADRVATLLVYLELKGYAERLPGQFFCRRA